MVFILSFTRIYEPYLICEPLSVGGTPTTDLVARGVCWSGRSKHDFPARRLTCPVVVPETTVSWSSTGLRVIHWNPFSRLSLLGVKGVDISPLICVVSPHF